jgi:uncharacterized protein (TIGR03437 family)
VSILKGVGVRRWGRCASLLVAFCAIGVGQSHAAGVNFAAVFGGSGQDYAASVASDSAGNTYIAGLTYSPDLQVTAGAFQTHIGGNGSLANPSSIAADAFVAKFGPDGTLLWSTFLGGSGDDYANGVAVDSSGNVLVTGWTRSTDFPVLNALQQTLNNGVSPFRWDAFVTKLDAGGGKLVYSTYLGGPDDDGAHGLAVDAGGNAYVTGSLLVAAGFTGFSNSASGFGAFVTKIGPQGALAYSFFHPNVSFAQLPAAGIAVDSAGSAYVTGTAASAFPVAATHTFGPQGRSDALVFKLSPDGSKIVYETTLGGSVDADGLAIALDSTGAAYIGGVTTSVDFPLVIPVQSTMGARPLWKSVNGGESWQPIDNLPFAFLQQILVDPVHTNTLYAATTDRGVFKSTDGGVTWNSSGTGLAGIVQNLVIDPTNTQVLYAVTGTGMTPGAVYKTVNGGSSWTAIDAYSAGGAAVQIAVDGVKPNNVYVVWSNKVTRKSIDGGATWSNLSFSGTSILSLALDPHVSGSIFAYSASTIIGKNPPTGTPSYIWHTTDGGANWTQLASPLPAPQLGLTFDGSANPSIVYNGLVDRSVDGGVNWTVLPPSPVSGAANTTALGIDPAGILYAALYNAGVYVSHDHGQTWQALTSPIPTSNSYGYIPSVAQLALAGTGGVIYGVLPNQQNSGFVTKLSPDGSTIVFSTLLNGHPSLAPVATRAAQPGVFATQNWISGIALDSANNVIVAGGSRSVDLPTANPQQRASAGGADAFVATLAADGSKWNYSTYYGGSQDDGALAVTLDGQGNLVFAGQTWSPDFPLASGTDGQHGFGDAFVVKLAPNNPPAISSVLNGASFLPGIEAGSWVMIKGSNLANTTRTWGDSDFNGANLPTSLSGVSVTIDGQPAFPYYISPTQINVQAPDDSTVGSVSVVVNNNGALSTPAPAQLQAYAPAFFLIPGTTSVIASLLPSYSSVTSTAPAHPGDLVVLWGTGFGPTTPSAPAGVEVSGVPVGATPTVTIGGVPATVLNSILAVGSAGLYQITIQLPAGVPAGDVSVQASIGGAQTASATLSIGKP